MSSGPGPASREKPGCSRVHRRVTRLLLGAGALWVIVDGLSCPLDLERISTWPWNQSWFMFSQDSAWDYRLELRGLFADGGREEIDPGPWFHVRATAMGGRLQEIPRDLPTMSALSAYLCARVNRGAPPGRRLLQLDVVERGWPRRRGRRLRIEEVPESSGTRQVWIHGYRCDPAPVGVR